MKFEVNCSNHVFEFVVLVLENVTKQLRKQCLNCGKAEGTIYKHSVVEYIDKLPLFNEALRASYDSILQEMYNKQYEDIKDQKQKDFEIEREKRKQQYANYLKSYEWKRKHDFIMNKYGYRCVLCFKPAVNIHHLTYDRVFLEDERDLIALCKNCHEFVHGLVDDSSIL